MPSIGMSSLLESHDAGIIARRSPDRHGARQGRRLSFTEGASARYRDNLDRRRGDTSRTPLHAAVDGPSVAAPLPRFVLYNTLDDVAAS
jgi:hypothetical protein